MVRRLSLSVGRSRRCAVLSENKRKTPLFGSAIATALKHREDTLRDPELGGKQLLRMRVLPARLLTHYVQQLRDIERWASADDGNVTITNEGAIEQGVAKIA